MNQSIVIRVNRLPLSSTAPDGLRTQSTIRIVVLYSPSGRGPRQRNVSTISRATRRKPALKIPPRKEDKFLEKNFSKIYLLYERQYEQSAFDLLLLLLCCRFPIDFWRDSRGGRELVSRFDVKRSLRIKSASDSIEITRDTCPNGDGGYQTCRG